MQCTSHAPLPVSQNGARTNTHLCLPTGLIVINCLRLKRECYFQGAFYSKAAWVTGSLLTWMTAQKTKHTEILHTASSWFPLSVFWLCWIQEKNRLRFYVVWVTMTVYLHVLFFLAALSNSSPTKHARPRRMITHRCSLRTRRTGHPGLTGATLHKWEQKKNKLMFLFFSPPIEVTHHYHCWHTLTLIPGMPGVPSFPSMPGRPWKSRQMSQWTSFGTPCQAPPQLWPEKTKVRSLTFSPFLPTAPCGPWIPRLPCRR